MVVVNAELERYIENAYKSPFSPVSFMGLNKIFHHVKKRYPTIKLAQISKVLEGVESYTRHFRQRRIFPRRNISSLGLWYSASADLSDYTKYSNDNDGYGWLLFVICNTSKRLHVVKMRSKKSAEVLHGLISIFEKEKVNPVYLWVDQGGMLSIEYDKKNL